MNFKVIIYCLSIVCTVFAHDSDGTWSYDGETGDGPEDWANFYPLCNGTSQSPIDLPGNPEYDSSLAEFNFTGYDSFEADELEMSNVGWTCKVVIKDASIGTAYFTGGGFEGRYWAAQLHFHWGASNDLGSDHTVNGMHYPAAMHIAHFKEAYGNISEALKHSDGAVIVVFFFQVHEEDSSSEEESSSEDDDDDTPLAPFFNALVNITYKGDLIEFPYGLGMFIPNDTSKFYRYNGSFTHPPCKEGINWVVFKHPRPILQSQLEELRSLYNGTQGSDYLQHITINGRPVQPLGDRIVKTSFP